tara:strand:+ start:1430 stop:1633 length:204 start_codon:yes stop_codon:yes gene_type:complete
MKKLLHPSGNKILIKFIGKRIKQISNNISKTYKLYNNIYKIPEKYRSKLLCEEEMAIIQSGGAYTKF